MRGRERSERGGAARSARAPCAAERRARREHRGFGGGAPMYNAAARTREGSRRVGALFSRPPSRKEGGVTAWTRLIDAAFTDPCASGNAGLDPRKRCSQKGRGTVTSVPDPSAFRAKRLPRLRPITPAPSER